MLSVTTNYLQSVAPTAAHEDPISGHYSLHSNHSDRHSNQNTVGSQAGTQTWKWEKILKQLFYRACDIFSALTWLRCMGTSPCFFCYFYKQRDNFCNTLFASLDKPSHHLVCTRVATYNPPQNSPTFPLFFPDILQFSISSDRSKIIFILYFHGAKNYHFKFRGYS